MMIELFKSIDRISQAENITISKHHHVRESIGQHTHDFIEIEYVWCGRGVQIINDVKYDVDRGTLIFLNFGDVHAYHTDQELGIFNCLLRPEFIHDDLVNSENAVDLLTIASFHVFQDELGDALPCIMKFTGREQVHIEYVFDTLLDEFEHKAPSYMTVLKSYVHILLTIYFREVRRRKDMEYISRYDHIKKITPDILKYIEENYNRKISLKELAGISYYNPTYFSTVFRTCMGKNVTGYIHEKRIQSAVNLIKDTNDSIDTICSKVGYTNKKLFYKDFKLYTGFSPAQFRKMNGRNK
jgi:AraC family transcriptional regulator, L-rhamnose operon transcriptional activator RhaR